MVIGQRGGCKYHSGRKLQRWGHIALPQEVLWEIPYVGYQERDGKLTIYPLTWIKGVPQLVRHIQYMGCNNNPEGSDPFLKGHRPY